MLNIYYIQNSVHFDPVDLHLLYVYLVDLDLVDPNIVDLDIIDPYTENLDEVDLDLSGSREDGFEQRQKQPLERASLNCLDTKQ